MERVCLKASVALELHEIVVVDAAVGTVSLDDAVGSRHAALQLDLRVGLKWPRACTPTFHPRDGRFSFASTAALVRSFCSARSRSSYRRTDSRTTSGSC